MKLSIAALSLTTVVTLVQGSMLRMNKQVTNNAGTVLGTEVIIKGAVGEPTAENMDFIGKALVASYNNVHWEVGHFMTGEHAVDFMGPDSILCRHW